MDEKSEKISHGKKDSSDIRETLNSEQMKYYDDIVASIYQNYTDGDFDNNYVLITGKAGTGKSYLASALVKHFQDIPLGKKSVQCTALTHKALAELKKKLKTVDVSLPDLNGVSTVHSYFNIKATINVKKGIEEFKIQEYSKKPKPCSILFIDEVSMLDEELFNLVKSQSYLYSSIVLIGDEFQVPPVNESHYNLFQDKNIKRFKLENIVRQAKDNPIINLASEIVDKIENKDYANPSFCIAKIHEYSKKHDEIVFVQNSQEFLKEYYDYVLEDVNKPITQSRFYTAMLTTFTNKTVDALNYAAKCIRKQSNSINYIDEDDLLIMQTPVFDPYLPDTIIMQNNAEFLVHKVEEDTYEGVPIYVVHGEDNFIRVVKEDPYSQNSYNAKLSGYANRAKADGRLWKTYFEFKKKFTEIKQCFAATTHKSQGSTVDRIFVDLKDLPWSMDIDLAFRLCYVAITRTSDVLVAKN